MISGCGGSRESSSFLKTAILSSSLQLAAGKSVLEKKYTPDKRRSAEKGNIIQRLAWRPNGRIMLRSARRGRRELLRCRRPASRSSIDLRTRRT